MRWIRIATFCCALFRASFIPPSYMFSYELHENFQFNMKCAQQMILIKLPTRRQKRVHTYSNERRSLKLRQNATKMKKTRGEKKKDESFTNTLLGMRIEQRILADPLQVPLSCSIASFFVDETSDSLILFHVRIILSRKCKININI